MTESSLDLHTLKRFPIFSDLSDQQIDDLLKKAKILHYQKDEHFFEQGEPSDSLYLIISGDVKLVHKAEKQEYLLTQYREGEAVGEMSLLDMQPRAATAIALKPLTVLKILYKDIMDEKHFDAHSKVFQSLSKRLATNLRSSRDTIVKALESELTESRLRVSMAKFVVYTLFFISLYAILIEPAAHLRMDFPGAQRVFSLLLIAVIAVAILYLMFKGPFPLSTYGFTTKGAIKSTIEALFFSVIAMAVITFAKWVFIQHYPPMYGMGLFTPFASYAANFDFDFNHYIISLIAYALFCPIQEIIVRGGLQSSLQIFLQGYYKHYAVIAIILSNLMFAAAHSHISLLFVALAFIPGLFWGWMYARQGNLIGVSISHVLVGVYTLFILGTSGIV